MEVFLRFVVLLSMSCGRRAADTVSPLSNSSSQRMIFGLVFLLPVMLMLLMRQIVSLLKIGCVESDWAYAGVVIAKVMAMTIAATIAVVYVLTQFAILS